MTSRAWTRSWRFARLEAMLLSKSFAVPVEPVKKPSSVVTSDQPFFYPGASTRMMSSVLVTEVTGSSLVQTTSEATTLSATQPVEAPGVRGYEAASKSPTHPIDGPGMRVLATQPVEAPDAGPEVLLTGTGNAAQTPAAGNPVNIPMDLRVMKIFKVNRAPLLWQHPGRAPRQRPHQR